MSEKELPVETVETAEAAVTETEPQQQVEQSIINDPSVVANDEIPATNNGAGEEMEFSLGKMTPNASMVYEVEPVDKYLRERIILVDFDESELTEAHHQNIQEFIDDPLKRLLVIFIDSINGLCVEHKIPTQHTAEIMYFIKSTRANTALTSLNFVDFIQFGKVTAGHVQTLLRHMMRIYAPLFLENKSWPDSIKNDFSGQLHKFLASLTDTRWKMEGKTVLYIPVEGLHINPKRAFKNKEMVQRLETAMIHWTRQVKEVLSAQDALQTTENAGPLEEIEFWKNRCADLNGIREQLDKTGVKRITETLTLARSSYINAFLKLSGQIKDGSMQAQSNLMFLSTLKNPCLDLSEAAPKNIPKLLPRILSLIRMIWVNSEFYNTRERVTAILRKLSNEIIRRCSHEINLDKIFSGHVQSSNQMLQQCIECCEEWKDIYIKMSRMHHRHSETGWVLDKSSVFAQIDAFIQRCKDLLEVCEAQTQFARMVEGDRTEMPHFAGQRGPEIIRALQEIENVFKKNLSQLSSVRNTILDVKATSWHDDYNRFRACLKDLEVMMQNAVTSAFDTVTTVEQGVEVLDVFMHLSSREAIKRTLDKKTVYIYSLFNDELNAVKRELTQKTTPLPPQHPKFSGQAHWARMLKRRIEKSRMVLDRAFFLPKCGSGEETNTQYQGLCQALDEYMRKTFYDWTLTVDKEPMKLLEVPLMCRSQNKQAMIDINFNKNLLKLFMEIYYWERMNFEIPHYASEVFTKSDDLRCQRENVLLVVRDYNRIIFALSIEERELFKERIRSLDKKIYPGLTKLTWVAKGVSEYFLNECRLFAGKIQTVVDAYKGANTEISQMCHQISQCLLIKFDEKRIYEDHEFDDAQKRHRDVTQAKLLHLHQDIVKTMRTTYQVFRDDNEIVQKQWNLYAEKMDRMVEEACRLNVKWSLQELSKAINGDGKTAPNPLFKVKVILENDKVEFSPTLKELASIVKYNTGHIIDSISNIRRLPDLVSKKSNKPPIHEMVSRDDDIKKASMLIASGMNLNATHLQTYLTTWDNFREIWEINKDAFILRYQRLNPKVSSFEADIARYTEVANNIQIQETILSIQFVLLDCQPLKSSILSHCREWQSKFTSLLYKLATTKMNDLHAYLTENSKNVCHLPQTLDELGNGLELWDRLSENKNNTESQFAPLYEQFEIMVKYEVNISDDIQNTFDNLNSDWVSFQQALIDSELMLKKHKEKFKTGLLAQSDEFKKQVNSLVDEFHSKGPFSSQVTTQEALANIVTLRRQMQELKDQEMTLRRGLGIFKIDQPPSKEVSRMEQYGESFEDLQIAELIRDIDVITDVKCTKDLDNLQTIWEMNLDWENNWSDWKMNSFKELKTDAMEDHVNQLSKKFVKMGKELKDKNWEILETSKGKVDQFKRTMPLVSDLKNNALRPRHWQQIQGEMNKNFSPDSEDFTLEKIIEYGFDSYAEKISEVSGAASKELLIETGLADIARTWEDIELDMVTHKDKGHYKIRSTEDLFVSLEDNQVKLSTMKASRFVKAFEADVDYWERTLSHIMEVSELLLTIQRQWMYLENIFLGEDIRRQLPGESSDFDDINVSWKYITSRLHDTKNVLRGTTEKGLYDKLNDMNTKLEEIQKSLDMYLETKRQIFPRFYFLSNDDLLEILGQSKHPEAVQPHLKKCFDNIKSLIIAKVSVSGQRFEAQAMISSDAETVPFIGNTQLEGPVEAWLCDIERNMRVTLKDLLKNAKNSLRKMLTKRDKWVKEYPGQICLTAGQIQWTADITKALMTTKERGDKKALKSMKKKQVTMLSKFSEAIRSNITKNHRLKIVGIVTIEVHARDIIEKLIKIGCNDVSSFDWLSQLRLYWDREAEDCIIRQTNTHFQYGYEYLGNSGRLVITPLTDRCYMTLTTALHLHRGGSPKGPAGTGKTETTKDLGKALGNYVIVVNCSEGLDYKSMGRMFSGLAQTGAWGCFDEFNRINIEVLSVVAQQILSILSALAANSTRFVFEGREIRLEWSCGLFITMNPGYAGRTELPDNLKSMFRPISMVVPDSILIAEIILFGEGFTNTKHLARKVYTFYSLAVQQLSKQDHYDFGLRALVSVLRYAGRMKRVNPTMIDEELLLLSLKDMNIAKLTSGDLALFNGIIQDLFPTTESPVNDYTDLKKAITAELLDMKLQPIKTTISKILQLYETKSSRHSVMIVGQTLSGKTVSWKTLSATLARLAKDNNAFQPVKEYPLNPKALSLGELYGEFDLNTSEWTDGVMSSIMRVTCADERLEEKWIVFDGPVDTLWIESMNSVMDDNKVLTLINGERISMPEQVSLLFEVENLKVASPATVSRCGMVFYDYRELGWKPLINSWLEKKTSKILVAELKRLIEKYIEKVMKFVKEYKLKALVPISELNSIISLCHLFDVMATPENGVDTTENDNFGRIVEMWFLFCIIWSIGAPFDEDSRKRLDNYIREIEGAFPNKDSIYEYIVEPKLRTWQHWEEKLRSGWRFLPDTPFYKIIVPTVDTIRYNYIVTSLVNAHHPVMLVGPVGTGKTSVAHSVLDELDPHKYSSLTVNMSAQVNPAPSPIADETSSNDVQSIIESRVEKRTKGVYVPVGGRKMVTLMDDFNMPAKDSFGSQPPLELIRLWLDYSFWYNRSKQTVTYIKDMYLLVAMGPPGGGRMAISKRLQSRFNLINMTFPNESQIKRIFGTMINQKLQDFEEELKPIGNTVTDATIEMYNAISSRFLPTPTKIHYLFNLRDISRIFQGLMRIKKTYHDTRPTITRLWIHECFRVFSDRLNEAKDHESFVSLLSEKLANFFDQTFHNICPNRQPPIFGDYMRPDAIYEDIMDVEGLKKFMLVTLDEYNGTPGIVQMDLVLFRDAIEHISKIVRVIRQPLGNMLLVGIGGSGRQSLSRVASHLCEFRTFQIEVAKHYRRSEFREDLRSLYYTAGVDNKPTVFLFTDVQVVEEGFLEDINNILSSGEVPNLYKPDEFEEVRNGLADALKKENIDDTPQNVFKFLIERVRKNLHIVLCMSPVGEAFRNRIRMFPAFVNNMTIDWFTEWPQDALLEVAEKYLGSMKLIDEEQDKLKPSIAAIFALMHSSVTEMSDLMLEEVHRHNYVTPTNYLELVAGYATLLKEKHYELGTAATKLRNGLFKIDETRLKVEGMSVELEEAKQKVMQFHKQCEDYLVIIVLQKREADEQQKSVAQKSEKIGEEETKCQHMADLAQHDLDDALPALEEAMKALESLNKKDMTEIKSYGRPPGPVEKVMEAVMILRGNEPTWAEAKRQLGDGAFIKQLMNFDKDNISDRVLKKIGQYCQPIEFTPDIVGRVSLAAKSLCMWVRAMEMYGRIYRVVEPKRQRLQGAQATLKEKQQLLQEAKDKLAEVEAKMEKLKKDYDEKWSQKEDLKKKAEHTEMMLNRASMLVEGLDGEKKRWQVTVLDLDERIGYLVGDVLIASAFLSYIGPFLSNYRHKLVVENWIVELNKLQIPVDPNFDFCRFMVKPTMVREWNIRGLPSDSFSTENGVLVTRGTRWPLMIDPQGQAIKWIKNMELSKGLKVIDLQQTDYMRTLESAIQFGLPVLLQNVQEQLDPSLDPILNKSIVKVGGINMMKLGEKEIEYNKEFRFYITTKLSNPHYSPEIASKTAIVNFAVKEQGLEAQLLGIVVRKERPELEEQKDSLVINIAAGKKKLQELEDEILRLLNEAQGSLLDDVHLVNTLQTSKETSKDVGEQLQTAELTEVKIDSAREGYRPCAERASILFFVLNNIGGIDPMYQFSLDAYIELFNISIDKAQRTSKLEERINNINDYHTYAVYRYTCRGLFEKHKMLFSFHMCTKILEAAGKLNTDEFNFFLRGGNVVDRENQMDNPCSSWLLDLSWDNITELEKLANFHGLITSFEQYPRDWHHWYTAAEPEVANLPGEWNNACNELQRMMIVRSLRPDRVSFCVASFIINNLGSKFIEPPILDMQQVVEDSTTHSPLIFVLSPGVDPTSPLIQLAEQSGMSSRFHALSLGQGQAPIATRMIKEGVREGNWVFLANCHLSLSWMPQLDKLIEQLQVEQPHPDFRLWLSSSPHPKFPISILQAGIKMTTEPPKGLKANLKRLYNMISDHQFSVCKRQERYRKLLFCLCYFHSVLIERRKFLMLGWNIPYEFNDSDFEVSENLLNIYLDDYDETPWDALKYLIAGINYGGHVTDDSDRRLLLTYIADFFCDDSISTTFYKLSSLSTYYVPKDGPMKSYKEYISMLPNVDHPEAFGQHPNADIASQITETRLLFETLLSLQPQVAKSGVDSREDMVLELSENIMKQIPANIDYEATARILSVDPSPLTVVLLQEIERYNELLCLIRQQLNELKRGIQGLVVMSTDLEVVFMCIFESKVPPMWEKAYSSLKPLSSWTRDLIQRMDQFEKWATSAHSPMVFWLSGFTFPTGFLTAVLQKAARQNSVSIDALIWEFTVLTVDDSNLTGPPKDGVYVKGFFLQGAGWDKKNASLLEAEPMQLVCNIPSIHFKPIESRRRALKGVYNCPCYYYPNRAGTSERPSFIVQVDLKTGEKPAEHWIKRGTALLLSMDT